MEKSVTAHVPYIQNKLKKIKQCHQHFKTRKFSALLNLTTFLRQLFTIAIALEGTFTPKQFSMLNK